ncbi:hypothetical protein ZWY2020_059450 [Hordeum vulgare]|nr:hypothetical protein ZWY2020_011444 [Hordeum vulgare]KAI5015911.1 hypothetical protein ZWY2020_059450 [Hordeum vulgare]
MFVSCKRQKQSILYHTFRPECPPRVTPSELPDVLQIGLPRALALHIPQASGHLPSPTNRIYHQGHTLQTAQPATGTLISTRQ